MTAAARRAYNVAIIFAFVLILLALWFDTHGDPDARGVREFQRKYPANSEAKNYR